MKYKINTLLIFFTFIFNSVHAKDLMEPTSYSKDLYQEEILDGNYLNSLLINFIYIILISPSLLFINNGVLCRYWFFLLLIVYLIFYIQLKDIDAKLDEKQDFVFSGDQVIQDLENERMNKRTN